jgi:S-formylglutathione hydrolase FrmB
MTDVVRFARRFRVILVMPDGGKGSDAGWCSDWKDSSRQWETFHTKVLIPYIDRTYRTLGAGHRGAFGISMGGFCAMSYAGRHRGLLRAAASFSGFLDTMYATPASGTVYHYGGSGYNGQGLGSPTENVWGSQLTDEGRWRAHNPTDLAPALKGVWLYLSSGFGTPGGPAGDDFSRPHSYVIENYLFQLNLSFTRALDDAGIRYIADFHAGYHHWPYWQRDMHNALPKLVAALAS